LGIISSIVQSPLGGFELRLFVAFSTQFWGNFLNFPKASSLGGAGGPTSHKLDNIP
jgi:hypothetical protein